MKAATLRRGMGVVRACFLCLPLALGVQARAQPADSQRLPLQRVALRLAAHDTLRIVAFGSSSTEGIGASSPAAAYPSQLQADLTRLLQARGHVIVMNRGIGGEDADDMAKRLASVIAERPDLIIWQIGSNDPLRGVPIDRFVQETMAGIQQIRDAHIDVMLMEPQLCLKLSGAHSSRQYRHALRAIGEGMGVPVIRRYDLMHAWLDQHVLTPEQMLAPDGLHMADGGYAKLAQAIARHILSLTAPTSVAMDLPARY
jgi:acyl-CoA thioesterase-1